MSRLTRQLIIMTFIVLLLALSLAACDSVAASRTPAIPLAKVVEAGGVVRTSLPIKIHHSHFQYAFYDEHGETKWETRAADLYPTDVFVSYDADRQVLRVFLARSPHMGCLLNWEPDTRTFKDPCFGSRFASDGAYETGPSPRSLDELPAEIVDGMIWVRDEVIYGQEHP